MTNNNDEPYFIIDLKELEDTYNDWQNLLPRVKPYYAMKCNPHPVIINHLYKLGCNFDCASKNEIEKVLNLSYYGNYSHNNQRIIFAHPCKYPSHIIYAKEKEVNLMTFDNEYELYKILDYYPESSLILRIAIDDSKSLCKFNKKFGCKVEYVSELLKIAKDLNLNVIGFSFHAGSGCSCPYVYYDGIKVFKELVLMAESLGFNISILDVGGGFMKSNFKEIGTIINEAIDEFFKDDIDNNKIKFIGEPGRYMVESCQSLYLTIIGKKKEGDTFIYYINDGIYGSFNCIFFDNQNPEIIIDNHNDNNHDDNKKKYKSVIFGNTCDSLDEIKRDILLPELNINDKIYIKNFGAYTSSASSNYFNGYKVDNFIVKTL